VRNLGGNERLRRRAREIGSQCAVKRLPIENHRANGLEEPLRHPAIAKRDTLHAARVGDREHPDHAAESPGIALAAVGELPTPHLPDLVGHDPPHTAAHGRNARANFAGRMRHGYSRLPGVPWAATAVRLSLIPREAHARKLVSRAGSCALPIATWTGAARTVGGTREPSSRVSFESSRRTGCGF